MRSRPFPSRRLPGRSALVVVVLAAALVLPSGALALPSAPAAGPRGSVASTTSVGPRGDVPSAMAEAPTLASLERSMGLEKVGPLPYAGPSPASRASTSLYVSNLGSDSAPCTFSAPCRQVSEALAVVVAGETIFVTNGTFLGFDVNGLVATKAAPVLIESPGRASVLVPTVNRSDNRDTVHIEYSDNVTLDGFRSFDANRAAVRIDTSDNITVSNCTFGNDTTWGIFTDFDHNSTLEHDTVYGSVQQHGIYVSNSPIAPILRWDLVYNNSDAGIQINADATQGGWGIESGGDIEDNVIYNNGASGAAGLNFDGVWNTRVVNNLIYDEHATGIVNYVDDGAAGPHGMVIEDNTVLLASNGRWDLQFLSSTGENYVRDNILDNLNPAHGGLEFGTWDDVNDTSSDDNVLSSATLDASGAVYTLAQWQALGHETHSLSASPSSLFVDYPTGDLELSSTSPAIGAGVGLANVSTDLSGDPRPTSGATDMGCYQYVSNALTAYAAGTPLSGAAPLQVVFAGSASGGTMPYSFLWSFGDGGPSSHAQSPTHRYNTTGTFPVVLSVTDAEPRTVHAYLNVSVSATSPLSATIAAAPEAGSVPLTVDFSSTVSGGTPPYAYRWSFGDGGGPSGSTDPQHTYNTSGTFGASLTVNDSAGHSDEQQVSVEVSASSPPPLLAATPLALPASGTAPLDVAFTGGASGGAPPYTFLWSFGDGSPTVSGENTSHTFQDPGVYTVDLTVSDHAGDRNESSTRVFVHVPALASSVSGPSTGYANRSSPFEVHASGGLGSYLISWNFDDGTGWSSPGTSLWVNHTFTRRGTFLVEAWVNTTGGNSSLTQPLSVQVALPSCGCSAATSSATPGWVFALVALVAVAVVAVLTVVFYARRRRGRTPSGPELSPSPESWAGPPPLPPGAEGRLPGDLPPR